MRNIDRVPVSLVHPVFDRLSPVPLAEYTYSQITSQEKFMRYEQPYTNISVGKSVEGNVLPIIGSMSAVKAKLDSRFTKKSQEYTRGTFKNM